MTGHRGKCQGQTGQRGNLLREADTAAEHFPVGEVGQVRVVRNRRGMQVAGRLDLAKHAKRLCGIVGEVAAAVHYVQQVVIPLGDAARERTERRGTHIVAACIDEQQPSLLPARPIEGGGNLPGDGRRVKRSARIPRGDHLHAGILEKISVVAASEVRVDDI